MSTQERIDELEAAITDARTQIRPLQDAYVHARDELRACQDVIVSLQDQLNDALATRLKEVRKEAEAMADAD